jgi:BON domain
MLRLASVVLLISTGFAADTKPTVAKKAPPPQGATAEQDKVIETKIRDKLAKSKIGKDGFKVRVQGGVAYWEGKTEVVQHKGAATRMAKTAGAKQVVNNIQISDAAKQKSSENLDQGRRRAQVKRSDPRTTQ